MGCCCGPGAHDAPDYSDGSTALDCDSDTRDRLRPSPRKPHVRVDIAISRTGEEERPQHREEGRPSAKGLPDIPDKIPIV